MTQLASVAGHLLRSMALPEALQCVTADPWEHCLYLGASDGRIFEASLVERREGGAAASTSGDVLAEAGIHTLAGHSRAVTCLATSGSGYHLVSGQNLPPSLMPQKQLRGPRLLWTNAVH